MIVRPFYTRSHWEVDQRCRRARYWTTEYGGLGIEPRASAYELTLGTLVHEALREFLSRDPQDEAAIAEALRGLEGVLQAREILEEEKMVQRATLEGMLRGWLRVVRPQLLAQYEVLTIEEELAVEHHGVTLGSKPDTLLRHRETGEVVYIEWKTTRNVEPQWLQSWHTSPQLVAGAAGAAATLGLTVDHAFVVGLYKGYVYKGQVRSPWAIGWRALRGNDVRGVALVEYATSRPASWKGWESFKVWEEAGGVRWWVQEALSEQQLQEFFVWTTAITPPPELVEKWLRQSALRELELANWREMGSPPSQLDQLFPMNFGACRPAYGFTCPFVEACWQAHVGRDPVGTGAYAWRVPHHAQDPAWGVVQQKRDTQQRGEETGA